MSSVLRPRGPQKAAVYWRRRAVALAAVIIVPILAGFLLFGGGSSQPETAAAPADPEPSASGAPGEVDDGETGGPTPSPQSGPDDAETQVQGSEPPEPPACEDSAVAVAVSVDQEAYSAGANPQIVMTITNTSSEECVRDIGSGANEVVISSGGHHAWSSDDCDPSQASSEQVLPAGVDASVTLSWERKLSAPGCTGPGSAAQAGTYQVEGRNGTVVSEPVRFVLQ